MDNFFPRLVLSDKWSYRLSRHVLFWLACWAFMGFIYGFLYGDGQQQTNFLRSYVESFIYLPQHMLLSYGIIYFILPKYILRNRYWIGLGAILILIMIAAVSSPIIQGIIINPMRGWLGVSIKHHSFFLAFMGGLRGSTTIGGFAVAIKLVKHWYFKKEENETLEKEKLKAELELLRGQLNPHFVFNTLNSIYSLALQKSDRTPESILKLSEFMRYMFKDCTGNTISLKKEIQMVEHYIDLARTRFQHRLEITLHIEGNFENQQIAPLIFLPFVENSFKYGTGEMLEHGWISIDLMVIENVLKFKAINGKPSGMDALAISSGVGLRNVKKRLGMLYPGAHELRITEDDDTFIVGLTIELDKNRLAERNEEAELLVS